MGEWAYSGYNTKYGICRVRSVAHHHLGSISLLHFALAANHGSEGGVDDAADDVLDERI